MEKQEAINLMKLWRASVEMNGADSDHLDAFDMAIEALSAQPEIKTDGDTISRQDAIDAINHELRCGAVIDQCGLETAHDLIEELPSAQPEVLACGNGELDAQPERKGEWIPFNPDHEGFTRIYECSKCNKKIQQAHYSRVCDFDICPHCGADMRGKQDD